MDKDTVFFALGGEDNEMAEIKRVLDESEIGWVQPQLEWGTIVVDVTTLPKSALGKKLIFVECEPSVFDHESMVVIDHHGEEYLKPASLLQVLELLEIAPSKRQQLIASIDANFLSRTMAQWPEDKELIWNLWESGFRKLFTRSKDFDNFKHQCELLYEGAKARLESGETRVLTMYNVPGADTLLSAMADTEGFSCILVKGSAHSEKLKPCFYQGSEKVVTQLFNSNLTKSYRGRYYFGCRAIPREFVSLVETLSAEN